MTNKLRMITIFRTSPHTVRKQQCRIINVFRDYSLKLLTEYLQQHDGKTTCRNALDSCYNYLKINNFRFENFTAGWSVYIFFKIYIPATVSSVSNGNDKGRMKCQN